MTSAKTTGNGQPGADKTRRESLIRDLYALVAFYVANPEHPLPDFIDLHHYAPLEVVERIAGERGSRVIGEDIKLTSHTIADTATPVRLIISQPREDRPL